MISIFHPIAGTPLRLQLDRIDVPETVPTANVTVQVGPLTKNEDGSIGIGTSPSTHSGTLPAGGSLNYDLPTPNSHFGVTITIEPTFNPSAFGSGDTRDLGAKLAASYGSMVIAE
jgi:hypothetical protein